MDSLTLHLIFLEIQKEISGKSLSSIWQLEEETFLFYFSGDSLKRLLMSVRPGHPRVHLVKQSYGKGGEKILSGFQALLRRSIEGLDLLVIKKERRERLMKFLFGSRIGAGRPDFILMLEMLGRSSNLILTDGHEKVLGFCRRLKSEFRQPLIGLPYQPPIRPTSSIFDILTNAALEQSLFNDRERAAIFIRESMKGVSEEMGEVILERARDQGSFSKLLNALLEDYEKRRGRAFLYSPMALSDIGEHVELSRKNFILSPFSLPSMRNLSESSFPTLNEAAEHYYGLLIRNELFARRKNLIGKILRKERARWGRTIVHLDQDRKKYDHPERFKRWGEVLLAGLKSAIVRGTYVECDDCYSHGGRINIPIDPRLTLVQNAERYFHKFRKAERGLQKIDERKEKLMEKILRLDKFEKEQKEIIDSASLMKLEEKLRREGIAIGIPIRGRLGNLLESEISGIRIFKSNDGLPILVGKTARDNMKLSFKIASPEDFWLHASGYGGAHVIVRNPSALKRLPERTLIEAAQLAAFYSSGKREGKIEVHYCKKKYVRKGKNRPLGAVLIKKFESILVEPKNPFLRK